MYLSDLEGLERPVFTFGLSISAIRNNILSGREAQTPYLHTNYTVKYI